MTWTIASVVARAFSQPWSGTPEQWMVVLTGACLLFLIILIAYVARRDGVDVVAQRFRDMPGQIEIAREQSRHPTKKLRQFRLALRITVWIVLALVLYFNFRKGAGG